MSFTLPVSVIGAGDTALAVLFGLLMLRAALTGLLPKGVRNPLWRGLCALTAPLVWMARRSSPYAVPDGVMPLVAAGWLWCARFALALFLGADGPLPDMEVTNASPVAPVIGERGQNP